MPKRVIMKANSGMPVFLNAKDVPAFVQGQKKLAQGERPENADQKASELLQKLKAFRK